MKKNFEWKNVLYFLGGLILGVALTLPSSVVKDNTKSTDLKKISYQEYVELRDSKKSNVILVGRASCSWCNKFTPIVQEVIKEEKVNIVYMDTDQLNDADKSSFFNSDALFTSKEFGTPTLIITNSGKITKYNIGYMEKEKTISWLKTNGILK